MSNTAPTLTERRVMAAPRTRSADISPTSWNAETRTIEVVWTTGARGARFDWERGETVDEELDTRATAVRLDRLNAGAPVLDAHRREQLASQIGTVVPGSARMQNGQGVATLRLSDRPELASIVSDIASGIIRNLSVGYTVHIYEIERASGQRPLYRAVDWEPFEISFVPVPFDAQAQIRSRSGDDDLFPCTLRSNSSLENIFMPGRTSGGMSASSAASVEAPNGQPATIAQLRGIGDLVATEFNLSQDAVSSVVLEMAERGLSEPDARREMLRILAETQRADTGTISPGAGIGSSDFITRSARAFSSGHSTFENPAFFGRAIEDALYARMSGRTPTEPAREFMHMSLVQIAGQVAQRAGVNGVHSMAPGDVLNASAWRGARGHEAPRGYLDYTRGYSGGYHTTSDFPDLLTAAGQRFLMDMFAAAESPLKMVGRRRGARDFRAISGLQLSGFGTLPEVLEAGEIRSGTFKERKETYAVKTFGKMFSLSRQAIINDDLGAFGDPIRIMSRAAAETEAGLLADLFNNNPVMSDGKALFHSDHGNLAGAGALPGVATLGAGRLAMRSQKDLDGVTPVGAAPKFILSSPTPETTIEQIITAITPNQVDEANPFAGKLTPLIDPRLDPLPWYLFADPAAAPVLEYAYLEGHDGPRVEMQDGWFTLGTSFRVYMDFGAGLVDWRGAYKNPGAAPA